MNWRTPYWLVVIAWIGIACAARPHGATDANRYSIDSEGLLIPPEIAVMNKPIPGFSRGLNLGNGFDAPSIGAWGVVLVEDHFRLVAEAGLDHVRLPVRFSAYAEQTAPYIIDESFFEKVDWALDMAERYGLSIIVDMHHYEELMKEPRAHLDRFIGMWAQIGERYRDRPPTVAFEFLNEPCDQLVPEILDPLMKKTFELLRRTNPDRLIFINGYFWSNTEWLDKVDTSYMDENTVVKFHMYQPILFTHQGAEWMPAEYTTRGVVFPGPPETSLDITDAALEVPWVQSWFHQYNNLPAHANPSGPITIYEHFDRATAFIEKTGLRTYLGEFGAIDVADEESRYRYIRMVREESERRGIGWCYWDDGGRNKGLDVHTGEWIDVIRRALLED